VIECLFGSRGSRFHHGNQDSFGVKSLSADTVLLAVADGAGSAIDSALGSSQAVSAALGTQGADISECFKSATLAVERDPSRACTLSVVVWSGDSISVGCVGDSPVVARVDGSWLLYTEKSSSEFANETRFITSERSDPLCFVAEGVVDAVVLFSDGLTPFLVSGARPHAPALDGILSRARSGTLVIEEMLEWLDKEHTLADDTTLVVAYVGE
jgi:hypothetical protein